MEEHLKWLQSAIDNPNRQLFILDVDGISVGQLRLDLEVITDVVTAEISYGLGVGYRGKGLGKVLLEQADTLATMFKIDELTAEVLSHNAASRKLFQSLGYAEEQNGELYVYRKRIR